MGNQDNIKVVNNVKLELEHKTGVSKNGNAYDCVFANLILEDGAKIKCSINQDVATLLFNK